MTDSTDTGVIVTLRGNRKKRTRQQMKRHSVMEINTYSFLKLKNKTKKIRRIGCVIQYLHMHILIDLSNTFAVVGINVVIYHICQKATPT